MVLLVLLLLMLYSVIVIVVIVVARVPRLLCCCLRVTITIVIAIVGSRSGCSYCGLPVTLGGKNVLAMLLIENVSTLLMILKDCCRSRICVPLLCCLHFMIDIAIVRSRSGCSCYCYCGVPVALQGKDVMVAMILIKNVLTLLLMIKDC